MRLDGLYKIIARVVLVSYTTTNLLAPLAHACDMSETNTSETRSSRSGSFNFSTTSETDYDYAEDCQYRLRVKTLDTKTENFQLKLVRKEKGSTGKFEKIHTSTINNGVLTATNSDTQDVLLNLFRGAKTHHFIEGENTTCFMWDVANFGTLKLGRDGSVFFGQSSTSLLLSYDLILKTSGNLFLQYVRDPKSGRLMDFKFKKTSID